MNQSDTDWARVRAEDAAGAPVAFDPEADFYDPNDEAAVRDFWQNAKVSRPAASSVAVRRFALRATIPPAIDF